MTRILREQILSGFIQPGEYLLTENEMCEHYNLSRTSVRKSLEQLVQEGLIVKRKRLGTMVNPELRLDETQYRTLRVFASHSSYFATHGMPIIIEAFKKLYPNVQVKVLIPPDTDLSKSIQSTRDMNILADLYLVTDIEFQDIKSDESYVDLGDIIENGKNYFYPQVLDAFYHDHRLKGVPVSFSTVYLVYNPDLFKAYKVREPHQHWTTAEFLTSARALTTDANQDGIIDQYGFCLSPHIGRWPVFALQNRIQNCPPEQIKENIYRTLNLIHHVIYRDRIGIIYPSTDQSNPFLDGKAATILTTALEMSVWTERSLHFEPQTAPLCFGETNASMLRAIALMVSSDSNHVELARAFIETAARQDVQEAISRQTPFLSVLKPVNEEIQTPQFLKNLNITDEGMQNNLFLHDLFKEPGFKEELSLKMEPFWLGLESASAFTETWLNLIEKYKVHDDKFIPV